jgi:hypothetical protein
MNFLGGPLAFYDLEYDEKLAALFWYLTKTSGNNAPIFASRSPLSASDLMLLAKEIFGNNKKTSNISGIDIFSM